MIYIISDDDFFSLGILDTLIQSKTFTEIKINSYDFQLFQETDIIIMYTLNLNKTAQILAASLMRNFKIIYAINKGIKINTKNDHWKNFDKNTNILNHLYSLTKKKPINKMTAQSLSRQEENVFDGLLKGKRAVQIAQELGIQPKTVSTHKKNALRKFNISNSHYLSLLTYIHYKMMSLIKQ
ncbi:LuxR family transcriptional regulator [Salmonella enterica subsp. enterica serovar Thompson]|nr:LuxR family transcriptional regulator [Salmonella enterica subsp. enterica]EBH8640848.1 LuxR family transcriptional regulator [Salmonella enterica subsp. enterica serovar Thompson]EBR2769131.1 helix-turn-helix transcriptional regulator [Salmonella enterica]EED9464866.1 helix-turn-helix transcriptional regulator [Salmonella enterica subsp. enterica serovar Abaetetuba]EBS8015120.1 helix-turn-helix transcriptional regulator [Salmonella enterica]